MSINLYKEIKAIKTEWKKPLIKIYKKNQKEMEELNKKLNKDEKTFDGYFEIFPPSNLIFNAFQLFDPSELKVVIIGQDPYHGKGQAMGLSFSVNPGVKTPPSLVNIYKEIKNNYPNYEIPENGDLTHWGKQGVLLLNASLTVLERKANYYEKEWSKTNFMNDVISYISENCDNVVFLLWGGFARKRKSLIDENKHYVLECAHPSPLSQKYWFGNNHFIKTNQLLKKNKITEIKW